MTLCFSLESWSEQNNKLAIENAMQVLDSFMTSFNARNMEEWSETLNYPHVRFAGSKVTVWDLKRNTLLLIFLRGLHQPAGIIQLGCREKSF